MKRLLWLCCLVLLSCSLSWAQDYYVATDGDDTSAGTFEKPFATLEKARDAVRQKRGRGLPDGGVTVWLRDGKYFRSQSFTLTSADCGEPNKPIVYRAYPGEQVRLIGGRELRPDWFSPVVQTDPAWSRLDAAARGQCLRVDLASHGVAEHGEALRTELSVNGELMPLARWPNEGFVRTTTAENDITFGYDDPRPQRWLQASDVYAAGYWRYGWSNRIEKIASIDTATRKITLAKSPSYGIQANKPYFVLNLLEEIDRPGEWYLDRQAHVLYFWPPSDVQGAEILISTLAQPVVSMKDASCVRLEGLILEMGADDAVEIAGGRSALVANCTIRNVRKDGITLSGENNGVSHCAIHDIGETGVSLSGGDRKQLVSCGNFVRDCRIHNFGRWERTYAPAIQIGGVGCIAADNLLYDGPHSAILFGGNEHLIELNEIYGVCYEVDDAGSVYCGRDWGLRGNVIRHNFFHNIQSNLGGSNGVHAVYLDDCASGITVFGNTFYQISGRAIMCGGGRDNTIENNVIARCGSAHFTDRRGKVWIDKDDSWKLLDKIQRYNYTQPPWSSRYPRLAHILDNGYEQAKEPEGCVIRTNNGWQNKRWLEKNCLGACGGFDFYTIENNIEDQDPRFVDEQTLNLALRDDSPAYSLPGFQRIPFEQIGPTD
ncbi:MAG: right-handed parallel beta-helix repeat-containing protein [Sedimentisphaerales bacterium]|nr:right-handed parallel beta-helix repeat-containing protein [Sedimentisphaerales bacterium]